MRIIERTGKIYRMCKKDNNMLMHHDSAIIIIGASDRHNAVAVHIIIEKFRNTSKRSFVTP